MIFTAEVPSNFTASLLMPQPTWPYLFPIYLIIRLNTDIVPLRYPVDEIWGRIGSNTRAHHIILSDQPPPFPPFPLILLLNPASWYNYTSYKHTCSTTMPSLNHSGYKSMRRKRNLQLHEAERVTQFMGRSTAPLGSRWWYMAEDTEELDELEHNQ